MVKQMDFLDIEIDEKLYIKLLIISIVLVIVFLGLTMSSILMFKSYTLGPNTEVSSIDADNAKEDVPDGEYSAHIDLLEHDGQKLEIAGWMFKQGEKIETFNSSYVLKNQETGKMYLMRTQMEENINLVEEEHKRAGLHAQCLLVGLPKGVYDIYVLYRNNGEDMLISTLVPVEL